MKTFDTFQVNEIAVMKSDELQRKLTITLGISSLLTLFLDAFPRAYGNYLYHFVILFESFLRIDQPKLRYFVMMQFLYVSGIYLQYAKDDPIQKYFGTKLSQYFFLMTKVNAMANFFIYAVKMSDIKLAIVSLLRCKVCHFIFVSRTFKLAATISGFTPNRRSMAEKKRLHRCNRFSQ